MGQTAQQPVYSQQNTYPKSISSTISTYPTTGSALSAIPGSISFLCAYSSGLSASRAMTTPQTSYQPQATQTAWPSPNPQAATPAKQHILSSASRFGFILEPITRWHTNNPQITNQSPVASNDLNDLLDGLDL